MQERKTTKDSQVLSKANDNEIVVVESVDVEEEFKIEILILIAKNYEYLNELLTAQECYQTALNYAIDSKIQESVK